MADRFYLAALGGLLVSGCLALVGSGYPDAAKVALACLLAGAVAARLNWGHGLVVILACLELTAAAVLSVNLSFFLFLAVFLFFLVGVLTAGEVRRSTHGRMLVARGGVRSFYARLAGLTLLVAVGILALTGGLFFVLPRTAHAAFSRLAAERYHLPGFSGEVRLDQIGAILGRSTPSMHVRLVDGARPEALKWRGTALSFFDGRRWIAPSGGARTIPVNAGLGILVDDDQRRRAGARVSYEIELEPIASDVLFFAGVPEVLWIGAPSVFGSPADVYRLASAPRERLRYGAVSYMDGGSQVSIAGRGDLQLPSLDERIPALAREIVARASSDEARALALESYLRRRYGYTTDLPSVEPADPLANFLFERRQGHCEYFATAMAVMLRTLGIPSRLITGFQGGAWNPISGWYVVRASDAHSWVEAWIDGAGWRTFDPTPGGQAAPQGALWTRVSFYADAAEMFWQDWVVGYDVERQVTLASKMQSSGLVFGARWRVKWLQAQVNTVRAARGYGGAALSLAALAAAVWFLWPKARARWTAGRRLRCAQRGDALASDATLLYARMLQLLKRRGRRKPHWLTPGEFARSLAPSPAADLVASLTDAYHDLRYGGHRGAAPRMIALLRQLERLT